VLAAADEPASDAALGPAVVEDAANLQPLRQDLHMWVSTARRLCTDLGLSPLSRARLGLDVALARRALGVVDLHRAAALEGADRRSCRA
jgi:hypothetical protein